MTSGEPPSPPHEGEEHGTPASQSLDTSGAGSIQYGGDHHGDIHQLYPSMELSESVTRAMFRAPPAPMNEESLRRLQRLFVPPPHYERARATLQNRNSVVITGMPGTGRRSAAMKLLSEVAESSHDLTNEADEEEPLDPDAVSDGEGILLDLSSRRQDAIGTILKRWEPLRAKVAAKRCFFVIVLPNSTDHLLESDLRSQLITLGRPDDRTVLERHLAWYEAPFTDTDLRSPELLRRLERESMAELNRLALLIRDAGDDDFAERVRQAFAALSPRPEHVITWLQEHPERSQRALILAAAMLAGAPTDAVFEATAELLTTVGNDDDSHLLEQHGISERLSTVGLVVDETGLVRFATLNFDHQVRTYFWRERPDLRDRLRDWVGKVVLSPALGERSRNELVFRFAEQALARARPDDLRSLTEQWVSARQDPLTLRCVAQVLGTGLADEQHGDWFLRCVYDWATRPYNSPLPPSFDLVLSDLCEFVIAPSHPQRALVRLRHLARRNHAVVRRDATQRIGKLAHDPIFFRRALYKLTERLLANDDSRDVALFLRIIEPQRLLSRTDRTQALLADRGVREQLVSGWRCALSRPVTVWEQRAREWLRCASDDPTDLPDVLVDACDRRTAELSRLHGLTRRWVNEATGDEQRRRARVAAGLTFRINACQNLEYLTTAGEPTP